MEGYRVKERAAIALKGAAMGMAEVVPGVSGGTIAFVTGIYERLLTAITAFEPGLVGVFKERGVAGVWTNIQGTFLVNLLVGMLEEVRRQIGGPDRKEVRTRFVVDLGDQQPTSALRHAAQRVDELPRLAVQPLTDALAGIGLRPDRRPAHVAVEEAVDHAGVGPVRVNDLSHVAQGQRYPLA